MEEAQREWCLGVCELCKRATGLVEHGELKVLEDMVWTPMKRWLERVPKVAGNDTSAGNISQTMAFLFVLSKTVRSCAALRNALFNRFGATLQSESGTLFDMLQRSIHSEKESTLFAEDTNTFTSSESRALGFSLIESTISEACIIFEVISSLNKRSPISHTSTPQTADNAYRQALLCIFQGNTEEALNHPDCGPEQKQLLSEVFNTQSHLEDEEENRLFIGEDGI